jgi:hypothetical protein
MQAAEHGQQERRCYRSVNDDSKKDTEYVSTKQCIYETNKFVCIRSQWKPYNMMCKCSA